MAAWICSPPLRLGHRQRRRAAVLLDHPGSTVELARSRRAGVRFDRSDTLTSIVSGIVYIVGKGVVAKVAMFAVALWVYDNYRIFDLDVTSPWVWAGDVRAA